MSYHLIENTAESLGQTLDEIDRILGGERIFKNGGELSSIYDLFDMAKDLLAKESELNAVITSKLKEACVCQN